MTKDRLVKPPSAKQHANARAYVQRGHAEAKIVFGPPKGSGLPTDSWWLHHRDREGFTAKAREEQTRIANSRFGQVHDPTYRTD